VPTGQSDEYARRAAAAPKLADSEAAELVALAQRGDLPARSELMVSHRRIVARLAKQYTRTEVSSDERIRLGEQGLVVAIEKFDLAKGFRFSTYATWRIRQAITMGLGGAGGEAGVREPRTPQPSSGSESAAL
jgi:DNA-directed RNA polymerase sigma subunit (sigma70/sigma32)